jgi:hypothetical protein
MSDSAADSKQPVTIRVNYNELIEKCKKVLIPYKTWIFNIEEVTGFKVEVINTPMESNRIQLEDFLNTPNMENVDIDNLKQIYAYLNIITESHANKCYKMTGTQYFKLKEFGNVPEQVDVTIDAATEAKFVNMTAQKNFNDIISELKDDIKLYEKWVSTKTLIYRFNSPDSIKFKHQYKGDPQNYDDLVNFVITNNINMNDLVNGYPDRSILNIKAKMNEIMAARYQSQVTVIKKIQESLN